MPWPDCAPCHSLPDGGGGNRPPSGQPNVPANSRQSGLRVPLAASSPRYLALTNIRRRSQSLPAATEDRHRPPSTPNRARTIALPCPYRPFRCCIVIPSVDLGLEEETCVSEVRAPVGSFVVLVKFDLLSPISVLDLEALSNPDSEFSHFDPDYIEKRSRERFRKELVGEMSRPVMPHEEAREYIATQIVSEYLANRVEPRLHGIIFSSAQTGKGGRNVVLFNGVRSVEADVPVPGLRVRIPPRPGIPQPGTESSKDSLIQTEPQRATAGTERSVEDPTTVDPETQGNHGDSILRLDSQSLKVLAISVVKYESKALPLARIHRRRASG